MNDKSFKYLNELMYHITTTHLDMGGKHRYALKPSGWSLVGEIKVWLAAQQSIQADTEKVATESVTQPKIDFCHACGTALGYL